MKSKTRLLIWSSIPTHHQTGFLNALRQRDIDLVVHYFRHVDTHRLSMGWAAPERLPAAEFYVPESISAVERCRDWQQRIHIVPGYGSLFLMRLAWFLSRRGVPWLHWSEHSQPSRRSNVTFAIKRFYGQLVRRHALGALAIGELARKEFVRWGIPAERIRFLPYAVDRIDEFPIQDEEPSASVRFLFLGALCPRKGIDILLRAMRDVLAVHSLARLELVGNSVLPGEYERDAERLEISHAVQFTRPVASTHIGSVLRRCDVLILPSRHDGWGVVLNEAASVGRAIIASDACGSAHHLVRPGVNGFRVPAGDATALAEAMSAYCEDAGLSARHGKESLRIFEEFTPERNAERFEEALGSLQEPGLLQAGLRRAD
jgi:glycosyltransferase involved in cell wall biosynthesis